MQNFSIGKSKSPDRNIKKQEDSTDSDKEDILNTIKGISPFDPNNPPTCSSCLKEKP
jgi:hypothetical protein